jgi:CubicO group peptidase (beta-lactamase class C family)
VKASEAASFGDITRRYIEEGHFPGAVLRVERRGSLLHEEAWGEALHTESESIPLATSIIFDLASVSKLFTTTAVLRLVTLGELRLESKAADVLSGGLKACHSPAIEGLEVRLRDSLGPVDIAALLAHSSGIHYWHPFYVSREHAFESILADVLDAHPRRDEVIYSDLNFMILGRIIESLTGLPLAVAVRKLVFEPLGLARSSYSKPLGPAAAGEFGNRVERRMVAELGLSFSGWRDESRPIIDEIDDGNCYYFFGGAAGHAGVFSDAHDLCRLGELYLDKGRLDGTDWLAPGLAERAMSEQGGGRGLGFQLGENYPGGGCGHTGFTGTYIHVNEPAGLVISILTNRLHVPEPRDINPYRRELSKAALSAFA